MTRKPAGAFPLLVILSLAGCHFAGRGDPSPTASGWLLVAPPNWYRDGAVRRDDEAPLWKWERLEGFDDVGECRRFRDTRVANASSDEEWAMWSIARCVTAERAEGGALAPWE